MAERRVLQFDHCDDQTRFEIEIVQELNNLKIKAKLINAPPTETPWSLLIN